ncbi:MAG: cyclase family protein [Bacteroidia bacterium]
MQLALRIGDRSYTLLGPARDIAIPLDFYGPQPATYGVPPATAAPYADGTFVGDVTQGGSCNFERYTLVPHCNGTHTECVGHLTRERIAVHEVLTESFFPATLCSLAPLPATSTTDHYLPPLDPGDLVLDREQIVAVLQHAEAGFLDALIVRTLPNGRDKCERDYMALRPPFFTCEAMEAIHAAGVRHLLVDFPSVDRLFDEGRLSAHRRFWGLAEGAQSVAVHLPQTITEMVYVPDDIADGRYLLELQLAPFMADAAPSRPRLFALT